MKNLANAPTIAKFVPANKKWQTDAPKKNNIKEFLRPKLGWSIKYIETSKLGIYPNIVTKYLNKLTPDALLFIWNASTTNWP